MPKGPRSRASRRATVCLALSASIAIAGCSSSEAKPVAPKLLHVSYVEKGITWEGDLERGVKYAECEGTGVATHIAVIGEYQGCVLAVDWPELHKPTAANRTTYWDKPGENKTRSSFTAFHCNSTGNCVQEGTRQ